MATSLSAVGGCGHADPSPSTAGAAAPADGPAGGPATFAFRSDKEPIEGRFPWLAPVRSVRWTVFPLGVADPRVPGPTDVELDGVAWLTTAQLTALQGHLTWQRASPTHYPPGLDPSLQGGTWLHSDEFDAAQHLHDGRFFLDPQRSEVYFSVLNPPAVSP
ncbi:hypothetical protein ACFW1A_27135 [Kitasatospora sp. NPDC058965]|uniref:hypothetical protein n=1 Tax=Kitasatospora sp. NPDC058965 TaxID=3346682 RepID=UPI0036960A38